MKLFKKTLVILMILAVSATFTAPFVSAEGTQAKLLGIYGNGMLFEQNKPAVFAGYGAPGSRISLELLNNIGTKLQAAETSVNSDGCFEISISAPAGGYDEYTAVLSADGKEFTRINGIVFGELWLSCGQSNMQYGLGYSLEAIEENITGSDGVRVLMLPILPTYSGENRYPLEPQRDIEGCQWLKGSDIPGNAEVSAVSYFFAHKLEKIVGMPVGILSTSIGGTSLRTWLSREAIDSDEAVKADLTGAGEYIKSNRWNEKKQSFNIDMTVNYNRKIAPLQYFNIAGLIWYQGENDILDKHEADVYARSFSLLQKSYTKLFNYTDGLLPVVFSQLASLHYDTFDDACKYNTYFARMQKEYSDSRALVSIYDIPLNFTEVMGPYHPGYKRPVGERMAACAAGLVYDRSETYTAASFRSCEVRDGSIYIQFANTGDGLASGGNILRGFTVCGGNGVYMPAQAEIVGRDTVRVYNSEIPSPVAATYAYAVANNRANLYSTLNGSLFMPVSCFTTKDYNADSLWLDNQWLDCDSAQVWHVMSDKDNNIFSAWQAENAELSVSAEAAFTGEGGLKITSQAGNFTVSPVYTYKKNLITTCFEDNNND